MDASFLSIRASLLKKRNQNFINASRLTSSTPPASGGQRFRPLDDGERHVPSIILKDPPPPTICPPGGLPFQAPRAPSAPLAALRTAPSARPENPSFCFLCLSYFLCLTCHPLFKGNKAFFSHTLRFNFAQEVEHYRIGPWKLNAWLNTNHATSIHGPSIQKASEGAKV